MLTLLPEWKQALKTILESHPLPGDVIKRELLEELFDLPKATNAEEWKERQFKWLQQFEKLRDALLTEHKIWLRQCSSGYEVVPPEKQTKLAYDDYSRLAYKKLQRMVMVTKNVDLARLTDAQRKENSDALAKMSMIVGYVGKTLQIEDKSDSNEDS